MPKCLKAYRDKLKAWYWRNRMRRINYSKGRVHQDKKRKRWQDWETDMLNDRDVPDRDLARILKRSVQSIQIKRSRVNK